MLYSEKSSFFVISDTMDVNSGHIISHVIAVNADQVMKFQRSDSRSVQFR